MEYVRVTKKFSFEMAHALWNYDGACKNIHGHSYKLFITIKGKANINECDAKLGMVLDFADLKQLIKKEIIDVFDHALVLNSKAPQMIAKNLEEMFGKLHILDYQPTCENLVVDFANRIKGKLPPDCILFSVRLDETATSSAEWYAEDNE